MKQYAGILMQYLDRESIPFELNRQEQCINLVFQYPDADIFSMFHYNEQAVTLWSILSVEIPRACRAAVENLLFRINTTQIAGNFYIDDETSCTVYNLAYCLNQAEASTESEPFTDFIRQGLNTPALYHKQICQLARPCPPAWEQTVLSLKSDYRIN